SKANVLQECPQVPAPADGDRRRAEGIFEDEIPADDPGDQLAERGVGVCISAARDRDHGGEFRVAQSRERAGQPSQYEGEHDRRARKLSGGLPGDHEYAGADDGADAESQKIEAPKGTFQLVLAALTLCNDSFDGFGCENAQSFSLRRTTERRAGFSPFVTFSFARESIQALR